MQQALMRNKYLGRLTESVIILLDELVSINNQNQLGDYLHHLKSHIPANRLLLVVTHASKNTTTIEYLTGANWPSQWISLYRRERFYLVDPILLSPARTALIWRDVVAMATPTQEALRFFRYARNTM
ncbi:autoinducer binding domain-containing protein [Paludibacterium denitrificans]|uniref:Transcription factor LuxR-like autoinducer-binding domain-containing protein n=1 Tax=Paludibacterium denitrificans TaxID=2675226 RepID=A0A844G7V5_9NEIS|nr:autoinducer binding domain-containing protein [Paludibacterium denitrificans]MTD32426.1 hypothetical protein [Paludibacterium denitrificans]